MTERDFYLWGSFSVFFLALALELFLLRVRARAMRNHTGVQP